MTQLRYRRRFFSRFLRLQRRQTSGIRPSRCLDMRPVQERGESCPRRRRARPPFPRLKVPENRSNTTLAGCDPPFRWRRRADSPDRRDRLEGWRFEMNPPVLSCQRTSDEHFKEAEGRCREFSPATNRRSSPRFTVPPSILRAGKVSLMASALRSPAWPAGSSEEFQRIDKNREWSEREDSNLRPPAPEAGALPGCATLRP